MRAGTRRSSRRGVGAVARVTVLAVLTAAVLIGCRARADSGDSTVAVARGAPKSTPRADSIRPPDRPVILFVGTSLTAGLGLEPDSAYPMLIQRKIDSAGLPFDVVNAGVSGETSSGLLDRLDWLLRGNFRVMVLETGANDGLRGIPTATLKTNLETILDRVAAKRPGARVLLVQMEALPNLGPAYAKAFHDVYPAVAKAKHVMLLPFLLADVAGHRDLNQADGVHPNYAGERIVANHVWTEIHPVLDSVARALASSRSLTGDR